MKTNTRLKTYDVKELPTITLSELKAVKRKMDRTNPAIKGIVERLKLRAIEEVVPFELKDEPAARLFVTAVRIYIDRMKLPVGTSRHEKTVYLYRTEDF